MESDREFFEGFVRQYTSRSLAYCRGRLGVYDAEDIVQDVMLRLFTKVEQIREFKDPLPYLYRALRNAVIDRARAAKHGRELDFDVAGDSPEMSEAEGIEATVPLMAAIKELPEDQREMVKLRYFDDLSVAQVAEVLGISPAATAMRLARARAKLKGELGKLGMKPDED